MILSTSTGRWAQLFAQKYCIARMIGQISGLIISPLRSIECKSMETGHAGSPSDWFQLSLGVFISSGGDDTRTTGSVSFAMPGDLLCRRRLTMLPAGLRRSTAVCRLTLNLSATVSRFLHFLLHQYFVSTHLTSDRGNLPKLIVIVALNRQGC